MTQQDLIIKQLKRKWTNSLEAVHSCHCLKLTTRVNEPQFLQRINSLGLTLQRREKAKSRYVEYRLRKAS